MDERGLLPFASGAAGRWRFDQPSVHELALDCRCCVVHPGAAQLLDPGADPVDPVRPDNLGDPDPAARIRGESRSRATDLHCKPPNGNPY
ncbi:hypothetical protein [Nocardia sp. NPDC058633]|uniref:hypothetical protein n=1 Tax=Nocardia sp. NPDC058633 TaxID=3346568 RepID=UPI00364CB3AD